MTTTAASTNPTVMNVYLSQGSQWVHIMNHLPLWTTFLKKSVISEVCDDLWIHLCPSTVHQFRCPLEPVWRLIRKPFRRPFADPFAELFGESSVDRSGHLFGGLLETFGDPFRDFFDQTHLGTNSKSLVHTQTSLETRLKTCPDPETHKDPLRRTRM